jgi:hypothetical protein
MYRFLYVKFVGYNLKISHCDLFVMIDLLTTFHTKCVSIFMTYPHSKFHMLSSKGNSVITI